uniref:Uncharacterized protein n=1 Tax=Anguilla anguilla TaxID=7936 RepID=A0A0E9RXY3_ANGAN
MGMRHWVCSQYFPTSVFTFLMFFFCEVFLSLMMTVLKLSPHLCISCMGNV